MPGPVVVLAGGTGGAKLARGMLDLAGDALTGVDVMAVEEGLDTGAVYSRAEVPIGSDTTADDRNPFDQPDGAFNGELSDQPKADLPIELEQSLFRQFP